jgi:hypothetical protein
MKSHFEMNLCSLLDIFQRTLIQYLVVLNFNERYLQIIYQVELLF